MSERNQYYNLLTHLRLFEQGIARTPPLHPRPHPYFPSPFPSPSPSLSASPWVWIGIQSQRTVSDPIPSCVARYTRTAAHYSSYQSTSICRTSSDSYLTKSERPAEWWRDCTSSRRASFVLTCLVLPEPARVVGVGLCRRTSLR